MTDEEVEAFVDRYEGDEKSEVWHDQWGYERWSYLFSKQEVVTIVREALRIASQR